MHLSDEEVTRFREAYRAAYGEILPLEEARVWALKLVRLYTLLLTPTPRETAERLAKSSEGASLKMSSSPANVERREPSISPP